MGCLWRRIKLLLAIYNEMIWVIEDQIPRIDYGRQDRSNSSGNQQLLKKIFIVFR